MMTYNSDETNNSIFTSSLFDFSVVQCHRTELRVLVCLFLGSFLSEVIVHLLVDLGESLLRLGLAAVDLARGDQHLDGAGLVAGQGDAQHELGVGHAGLLVLLPSLLVVCDMRVDLL